MTVVFYVLWSVAVASVLTAPLRFVVRKAMFVVLIAIGVWLLIGVSTHQSKFVAYELRRLALAGKIEALEQEKQRLEAVLAQHPTSRDALLALGELSYRLRDDQTLASVIARLEQLDPNNPRLADLKAKRTQ